MAKLSEVRRRFPPGDAAVYAAAYAEAEVAERLGTLLHLLRVAAGVDVAELAARLGVDEEEVLRAEEGGGGITLGYLDRVAVAVGVPTTVTSDHLAAVLEASATPPPDPPGSAPPPTPPPPAQAGT